MRKLPDTSLAAHTEFTKELLQRHYDKILAALGKLKSANYENIAIECNLDRHSVGRRMSELMANELVWKPGGKSKTSTGRDAYNYQLTTETTIHPTTVEKAIKKGKSISDYSKSIQKLSTPIPQLNLF